MDTIYALASAQGKAGVSVIRLSGPAAFETARVFCDLPAERVAALRTLRDPEGGTIDQALVLVFPAGHSFTGEPTVEFQTHGSIAVVRRLFSCLSEMPGVRLAEPGEFTRRALENNRLDLTQVEGLADLVDAETELQRAQAMGAFSGRLRDAVERWRRKLVRATALVEASIDFADEDIPEDVSDEVIDLLSDVMGGVRDALEGISASERIRSGFEVAIVGRPNVGKSTLLNALAGRRAALTSEIAGTTRDIIEVRMDIRGLPVTILDTAGLRDSDDVVEAMGIALTKERAEHADLRVFLVEGDDAPDMEVLAGDIVARAKADLAPDSETLAVSGRTGHGVSRLLEEIHQVLSERVQNAGIASRERHRGALMRASNRLEDAIFLVGQGPNSYDLAAFELRSAVHELEALVGRIDVENVLDEIFSSFCLGK